MKYVTCVFAIVAASLQSMAADFTIEFDPAPPNGIPAEANFFAATTNHPSSFVDLGEVAKVQIRYYDTNALTRSAVSNYLHNITEMNPRLDTSITWAEWIGSKPSVEAYVTFNNVGRGPSRWLIWPGRSVLWSPSGRWLYITWMQDAKRRQVTKK